MKKINFKNSIAGNFWKYLELEKMGKFNIFFMYFFYVIVNHNKNNYIFKNITNLKLFPPFLEMKKWVKVGKSGKKYITK